jgi:hypothetical protein
MLFLGGVMTINSTMLTVGTVVDSNKAVYSYFKQIKNFCALLISMHRGDSSDEKSLCPLVVAILGEMIGAAPQNGI